MQKLKDIFQSMLEDGRGIFTYRVLFQTSVDTEEIKRVHITDRYEGLDLWVTRADD